MTDIADADKANFTHYPFLVETELGRYAETLEYMFGHAPGMDKLISSERPEMWAPAARAHQGPRRQCGRGGARSLRCRADKA